MPAGAADRLIAAAAGRIRAARPDLVADLDLSSMAALEAARARIRDDDEGDEAVVVAVIRAPDLPRWIVETCVFALSLPADRADAWRRGFTRTLHLAGQPRHLGERFRFAHVAGDGSAGWTAPAPASAVLGLRRLLKTFAGERELRPHAPVTVRVPYPAQDRAGGGPARPPVHRDLYYATARVSVAEGLVHLNHLLAEAVLDGLVGPGDRLTLRPVPRLTGLERTFTAVRAETDVHRPHTLQAYAALTEEL
ncbi:DUF6182 family protein [Streptomyces sp. SL13]|uniref:DUF6182 family protein n=1 Tax=Streptantibioticus silvisoli TaxID=2705255 RepID=A0AA90GYK2_9ACTN|nr:DUF6182 family protein [Streptantibioticus silvisoli]MDI5968811.1 DUF6182 family protein [Streptantibioticus silvisoli]